MKVDLPSRSESAAAVRLFRGRSWVLASLGVVVLSVVFVVLGGWQYSRHEAKVERRDTVEANFDAPPVPLGGLLGPQAPFDAALEWRRATAEGTYLADLGVLLRNRTFDGANGYEVLVPLRLDTGGVLLVDRGWVPSGADARQPDTVPAPPPGPVQVTVHLRPGEPPDGREPPAGQALRIDLDRIAAGLAEAGTDEPVYRAYGVLAEETPRPDEAPRLLGRPDVGLGINLAYSVQWYGFAVAAYVLLGVAAVREVRRSAVPGGPVSGGPVPGPARRPERPGRVAGPAA